jgi:hypothetical protein
MPTKLFVMFKLKPSSMLAMRKRFLPLKRQLFPMLIKLPDMQLDKQRPMLFMLSKQFLIILNLLRMLVKLPHMSKFKPAKCLPELQQWILLEQFSLCAGLSFELFQLLGPEHLYPVFVRVHFVQSKQSDNLCAMYHIVQNLRARSTGILHVLWNWIFLIRNHMRTVFGQLQQLHCHWMHFVH